MSRMFQGSRAAFARTRLVRGIALILPLVLLIALLTRMGWADPALNPALTKAVASALKAAGNYTDGAAKITDLMLQQIGYDHAGITKEDWREFPTVYMLESAYMAAEAHEKGEGERFLALLSRTMAQYYDGARLDPALKDYIALADKEMIKKVNFKEITRKDGDNPPDLPAKVKAAIDVFAKYSEGGGFGLRSILVDHWGLDPSDAYEIMRTSRSRQKSLELAYGKLPEEMRQSAMEHLADVIFRNFEVPDDSAEVLKHFQRPSWDQKRDPLETKERREARRQEQREAPIDLFRFRGDPRDARPWRPDDGPQPPDFGKGGPGGHSGGPRFAPPSPEKIRNVWRTERSADYGKFVAKSYPKGSVRSGGRVPFRSVIRGGRGFGGVVFGSEVKDDGLPAVKNLRWESDATKNGKSGTLIVAFEGQTARLKNILAEDVYAAHAIYYQAIPGKAEGQTVGPAEPEDAIGLVGLGDGVPYFDCGPTNFVNLGTRRSFTMHPGVADLGLGWSALMCDVLPFRQLRGPILKAVEDEAGKSIAESILREWDSRKPTWKVSDVPMRVVLKDNLIVVERTGGHKQFPAELRTSAWITFNTYSGLGDDDLIEESGDRFYPLVPHLVRGSADYERLNNFARVCAVVRWAKGKKAEFAKPPQPPSPQPRAASIVITERGVVAAPVLDSATAYRELFQKVSLRLATLNIKRPELVALEPKLKEWDGLLTKEEATRKSLELQVNLYSMLLIDEKSVEAQIAKAADQDLAKEYDELRKKITAAREARRQAKTRAEVSDSEGDLSRLIRNRHKLLFERLAQYRRWVLDVENLREKIIAVDERILNLNERRGEFPKLLADVFERGQPELVDLLRARFRKVAAAEEATRNYRDKRKKISLAETYGLPKVLPADVLEEHAAIQKALREAEVKLFVADLGSKDREAAGEQLEKVEKRRDAFEQEYLPDLFRLRQEAKALEKGAVDAQKNLAELRLQLEKTIKQLCPEFRYWCELREARRQLTQVGRLD